MRFSDIAGHDEVKKRLRDMVDSNQLPHALLLYGPEGTGKLQLARALVSYLHCAHPTPDGDSCGRCPSCLQHRSLNHVDTHFTFPIVKSGEHPVSADFMAEWREFLNEDPYADFSLWLEKLDKPKTLPVIYLSEADAMAQAMSYTTRIANYKVAVVWLPERFNKEAANKLLKLVEEPFPDTRLVFVSNNPQEILPTIYSRLQRIEVKKLDTVTTAAVLTEMFPDISQEEAADVAAAADGNVTQARSMLEGSVHERMLRDFITLMRLAFQRKVADLKMWSDEMSRFGRDEQIAFLNFCCRMLRENFINNTGIPGMTRMTRPEREFSRNFSRFINSRNVMRLTAEFEKAITDIAANGNAKIVFFDLSLRVILLIK